MGGGRCDHVISVEESLKLKTAAELIQDEPVDPTKKLTDKQLELLNKVVNVLEVCYLLDENASPFGEKFAIGDYILRSRRLVLNAVGSGKCLHADNKLKDTQNCGDVQFVFWSIVNIAFSTTDLNRRSRTLHETSPGTFPSSVRFQASSTEQEIL